MAQTSFLSPENALNTFQRLNDKMYSKSVLDYVIERGSEYFTGSGVKGLLEEVKIKAIRNLYLNLDIVYGKQAVAKELSMLETAGFIQNQSEMNIYLGIRYDFLSQQVETVVDWVKRSEKRIVFIQLEQRCYISIKDQQKENRNIINYICKAKLLGYMYFHSSIVNFGVRTGDVNERQELERSVLMNAIQLYEADVQVIGLEFELLSLSIEVLEWRTLEQFIKQKKCTINGSVWLRSGYVKDISWLENFFQLFKNYSRLILPNNHELNFKTSSIQHLQVFVGYKFSPALSFTSDRFNISLNSIFHVIFMLHSMPNDIVRKLTMISFLIKKQEVKRLLLAIKEVFVAKLLNIYDINVVFKEDEYYAYDLSSIEEGREILAILEKRETKRMNFLIKNNRQGKYNRAKMMVVGAGGAGKTSLCNSLLEKPFIAEHHSTVVANAELNATIDTKDVDIFNWRELGKGETLLLNDFKVMASNIVRDKSEGQFKVNKENKKIYENTESLTKLIRKERLERSRRILRESKEKKGGLWGWFKNKKNGKSEINDKARQPTLLSTSEHGRKLSIWDFGGQKVFDVLHHLYLTNAGLILLVVNLVLFFTDPELAITELEIWFKSLCVYTKCVKIFIVGTRAKSKKLKKNSLQKINAVIENVIFEHDAVKVLKNRSEHGTFCFFPVENSLGKNNEKYLRPLKAAIVQALEPVQENNELSLPVNEKIPLAWMLFIQIIHRDMGNVVAVSELYKKGQGMGFDLEEVKKLVDFFTRSGIIVSFHERFQNIGKSEDTIVDDVVLKPNWLLSVLGSFICDESLHNTEFSTIAEEENMGKLVKIYRDTGILANSLLEGVLRLKHLKSREISFVKNVCQKMLILSKLSIIPDELDLAPRHLKASGGGFWMVPAMNKMQKLNSLVQFGSDATEGTIKWLDIVPQGLYERCVCALLSQDPKQMELEGISLTVARINYKGKILELEQRSTKKYQVRLDSSNPILIREVRAMLLNVCREVNGLGFALQIEAQILFGDEVDVQQANISQPTTLVATNDFKWDCFLSHTWSEEGDPFGGTHERVIEVAGFLRNQGLRVWIDDVEMRDATDNCMIQGIEQSAVFLAFITKSYLTKAKGVNNNSRKEFIYAADKGSEFIIPVLLNGDLSDPRKWDGPVKFHLGTALYYNLSTPENMNEELLRLCQAIRDKVARRRSKLQIT